MDWEKVRVRAKMTMLDRDESGWNNSISTGLRPNHNFYGPENINMCFGEVTISEGKTLAPGESGEVLITFALLPEYNELVEVGFKWRIQAASQHFANGEILEILHP